MGGGEGGGGGVVVVVVVVAVVVVSVPGKVFAVAGTGRSAPLLLEQRRTRLAAAPGVVHHPARPRRLADVARLGARRPLRPVADLAVARWSCAAVATTTTSISHAHTHTETFP